jgi:creatinine amidohydrolase
MIPLLDLPHDEARRLVATGLPVYLPVNPVEYHGPHLSLHNDRLVSHGLISDMHARIYGAQPLLVAADLEIGVDPCPGVGTRFASFATTRAVVMEACRALAELGAKRVVLMTFHGAPLHNLALEAGVRWLQARGVRALAPFHLVVHHQLHELDPAAYEAAAEHLSDPDRDEVLRGLRLDFHAGFFETSMALLYAPESVSPAFRSLPRCPAVRPDRGFLIAERVARAFGAEALANELGYAAVGTAWTQLRPFPGYTGRPDLATAEAGRVFADAILARYVDVGRRVLEGEIPPPEPVFRWVARATLGGRIVPTSIAKPSEMWVP